MKKNDIDLFVFCAEDVGCHQGDLTHKQKPYKSLLKLRSHEPPL